MATTEEGKQDIAAMGTSPEANKKLYDSWAEKYTEDVRSWGYTMPEDCAKVLKKHVSEDKQATCKVLDAGAGDGLSGQALVDAGFKEVMGVDLSPELCKLARKKGVYKSVEVANLAKPLKLNADAFDAATVVGVMTYLEPDGPALEELCRVVKPGGFVLFTHRSDKVDKWNPKHDKLVAEGKWEKVEVSDPLPYLPGNPEYGDSIKVIIHVYRVCKKDSVDMKVPTKRSSGFYVKAAKGFFEGTETNDGEKKDPVKHLTISGLGDAINTAVQAALACEQDGLGTITKIETTYPDMQSGGATRGCAAISLRLDKK